MTIECPVCGREVVINQYDYIEEMCYDCLKKVQILAYEQEENEEE
jgi:NMD protein affecting ribosome stability and mRNA decay